MSNSELSKSRNIHNESEHSFLSTQKKSYIAIDMESVKRETATPASLTIAKSIMCIDDRGNVSEQRTNTNEEVEAGKLANVTQFSPVHMMIPIAARRKPPIKEFYDSMVDFGKTRLARLTGRQEQPPPPPQQPVMTRADRAQIIASHLGLQTQVSPTGPKYLQAQGWGQGWGQGQGQGFFPPAQAAPGYGNQAGYPQNPGYAQGSGFPQYQGYPQSQGYPPDQGYVQEPMIIYNPKDRNPFVALVMGVTCIMLAATAIFVGTVVQTPTLRSLFRRMGLFLTIPCILTVVGINYAFICCKIARKPLCGAFLLTLTVFAMGTVASVASSLYNTAIVFQAVLATTIIVALCTLLACSNFDFTSYIIYFIAFALVLSVVSMVFFGAKLITGKRMSTLHLIILLLGTGLQSMILIAELQMILGGKSIELHEDEWALGAFFLYLSIVDIFIKMMGILGIMGDN